MSISRFLSLLALVCLPFVSFAGPLPASAETDASLIPDDLRCEYRVDPLGIDVARPRLSWKLRPAIPGARNLNQKAYHILVAATLETLAAAKGDRWDSGKVDSDRSIHVEYAGQPLQSQTSCWWKVRVWDQDGRPSAWSKPAHWTMGLLHPEDWQAEWIGLDGGEAKGFPEHRRLSGRMLRREFQAEKPLQRATASVCGLGFFDLYVNGHLIGDQLMNPALTGYDRRALYVTFDVTSQLKQGANAVGVVLGNGRFFAPRVTQPVPTNTYGYPKMLFQLRLEYADGSVDIVPSDGRWKLTTDGPLVANNEYDGEEYDARREQPGWSEAGFDDSHWQRVQRVKPPGGALEAQLVEPIRITEVLKPVAVTYPRPGIVVVDFGQSFYGVVRLRVTGPAGTCVHLHTTFNVTREGLVNPANDRSAANLDMYTLRGGGEEVWNPRFKGNATRYVQVEGFSGKATAANFEGLVVHTDMEPVGQFTCSRDLINRIYANARWGTRMQNRSVPMEPDRDERMPWSGHPAKTSESEGYVFDVARFYDHYLHNYRVHQGADGSLQEILPPYWTFNSKDVVWPSVVTIIPDWFHDFYGDDRILADNYECMKRFVQFHEKAYQKADFTVDYCNFGDWVDSSWLKENPDKQTTSRPLLSTAYHYHNCRLVARAAGLLGKADDARSFNALADRVKEGFNHRFFNATTDRYESDTQGAYVFALAFGLVPEDHRPAIIAHLIDDIMVKHKGHPSVGLVGMQWFLPVLTEAGRPDVAYAVATQTTKPSWGYMVSKGATTIWERWDTDVQDGGMNGESQKILSGSLEAWLYQTLGGIRYDPDHPGFKHTVLHPYPVGDLTYVRCAHRSLYGDIVSNWKIEAGAFHWDVTIPPNTTATVFIPTKDARSIREGDKPITEAGSVKFLRSERDTAVYEIGSGSYSFVSPWR